MMKKKNVLGRLLKDIFKQYKVHLIIVFLCIIGNAIATVQGTLFMQVLIDDYIIPLMELLLLILQVYFMLYCV